MKTKIYQLRIQRIVFALIFVLIATNTLFGAARTASVSGNWSNTATWGGASVPTASDAVTINSGITLTIDADANCTSIAFASSYSNAATINLNSGKTLTVSGNITFKIPSNVGTTLINVGDGNLVCNGTIALIATTTANKYCELQLNNGSIDAVSITSGGVNSKLTVNGTGTVYVSANFLTGAKGTFSCGSGTVVFDGTTQNIGAANINYTFYNLTLANSGAKTFPSIYNGINTVINNRLTISGSATISLTLQMFEYGSNASLIYNRTGGTATAAGVEWISPFTPTGGVTISGSTPIILNSAKVFADGVPFAIENGATLNTNDYKLSLGGDFIKAGEMNAAGSTFAIIGSGAQNIGAITTVGNIEMTKTSGTATFTASQSCANLIINGLGGTLDLGSSRTHTISQDWIMAEGTVLGNSSTLSVYGALDLTNGVFDAQQSTIEWKEPFADISVLPYYNLKLSNITGSITGYGTSKNININGNLNLNGDNPSTSSAMLDMGNYTLLLGATATVTGIGDISGTVERTTFLANTEYTFNNQFTSIYLSAGGTLPSSIKVKCSFGNTPNGKADAILRSYEIACTGGSGVSANLKLHYLDGELNSNVEQALTLWNYDISGGSNSNFNEFGKSEYNYSDKWIAYSNIDIASFPDNLGELGITISESLTPTYVWQGTHTNADDWYEPENWLPNGVPDATSNVIIPDGAPEYPVVPEVSIKTLTIESSAIFDGSDYNIIINGGVGAWNDPAGNFNPGLKKVTFTNPEATIKGNTIFHDLVIDDNSILTIEAGSYIKINHSLTLNTNANLEADFWSNTVEYDGSANNVIVPNGVANYSNLVLNGEITMPSSTITVEGSMDILGSANDTARGNIICKRGFTVEAGSTFYGNNNTITFGEHYINEGTVVWDNSNINFDFELDQLIDVFATGGVVSFLKPSGSVHFNGDVEMGGLIMNGEAGTLYFDAHNITINGNVQLSGGILDGGMSTISLTQPSANTWTNDGSIFLPETSTVQFVADGDQTISATNNVFYALNFSGTGTKDISGTTEVLTDLNANGEYTEGNANLTIWGNLNIGADGTFIGGSFDHILYGNLVNDGVYDGSAGNNVIFNSDASEQYINGSGSSTVFDNLTMNNTYPGGYLLLNMPVVVENTLNLTNNNILTDAVNQVEIGVAGTVSPEGGQLSSFVDGPISKTGSTAFVFPVGDGARWARIAIGNPSASATFSAEYFDESYADTVTVLNLHNVSKHEYWDLHRVSGTATTNISLFWEDTVKSGIHSCTDLRVAHWNGFAWENVTDDIFTSGCNPSNNGHIRANTQVGNFSPFTFGSLSEGENMLPISLLSFEAYCNGSANEIIWKTSSEENNDYFVVEHSANGKEWSEAGKVSGSGKSNQILSYSLTDENISASMMYYRLKQVDFDGKVTYSTVIKSKCETETSAINLFPNPALDKTTLEISSNFIGQQAEIYNVFNQLVSTINIENRQTEIDLKELKTGMYVLVIRLKDGSIHQQKLMVE